MGHANLTNISQYFIRRLRRKKTLSVREVVDSLERAGETVHASEGQHGERYMLSMAVEEVVGFLRDYLEPVGPLSRRQARLLKQWEASDFWDWDAGDDGEGGDYAVFDSIKWRVRPEWRRRSLPILGNVTH